MKKTLALLALLALSQLFTSFAFASVTLPYGFSASGTIRASEMNADLGALRDEINAHESNANGHNTKLSDVLSANNSCGLNPINFNNTQALSLRVENLSADPVSSSASIGRLIYNTTTNLLKVDTGTSYVAIAGTGVNNLSSVLNSNNSAGAFNINLNGNQLLSARVENLGSDPSPGNPGRLIYNTTSNTLKVDTGSIIQAIGGAQGLASVLGVSNSLGAFDLDYNGHQAVNARLENLASDPGTTTAGRLYYNTTSGKARFYNGTSWGEVGNSNTLAQTMALGNSTGSFDLDLNSHQLKNARVHNLAAPPGTGTAGMIWFDTVSNQIQFETPTLNRTVCTLDDSQTITNKSISGSSNTLTNIPDSALSSNVGLLNSSQTVSGTKTFSAAPIIANVKPSGASSTGHVVPNVADDTFTLNNAVQTLNGKTLNAPTLSGNMDFANYQAVRMRAENIAGATPAAGQPGRIIYKTSTGELLYDTGTAFIVLGTGTTPNLALVLAAGNSAGGTDINVNNRQLVNARLENVGALPAFGNLGRVVFNTSDGRVYGDTGAAWLNVGAQSWGETLIQGNSAGSINPDFNLNQALKFRIENLGSDPAFGNVGRLFFNTATNSLKVDTGTAITGFVTTNSTDTFTNKSIDASTNTLSNIVNSNIKAAAAIAVNKLAALSPNLAAVMDASGFLTTSATTATELGYVSGVTSSIQTQINGKQATGNYVTALTGDVSATGPGSVASTIQSNVVSNSKLAQMPANTIKGNNTGSTANAADLTATQTTAMLNAMVGDSGSGGTKGLVPAPASGDAAASKFLKADGTWTTVSTSLPVTTKGDLLGFSTLAARIPVGTDGQTLVADSAQPLGLKWAAASGGGGVNYVGLNSSYALTTQSDRDAEVSVGNWTTYNDSAAIPVDLTGGSATGLTFTRSTTGADILNGTASFKIVKSAANAQGQGVSVPFYIPPGYRTGATSVTIPYKVTSGTITTGDVKAYLYDVTNSTLITPSSLDFTSNQGIVVASFTPSSTTAQVRVGIHFASTNATAVTMSFDDVTVAPAVATVGLAGSDSKSDLTFTPNNFGTPTSSFYSNYRHGDRLHVKGRFVSGTTVAANASLSLPVAIDSAKMPASTLVIGHWEGANTSALTNISSNNHEGPIFWDGSDTSKVYFAFRSQTNDYSKMNANDIFVSGDLLTVEFDYPASGYTSQAVSGVSFPRSEIAMAGGNMTNAQGTTNTFIRNFVQTPVKSIGTAITYVPSLSLGDSFVINEDGVYSMSRTDFRGSTSAVDFGISVNAPSLTTDITAQPAANRLAYTSASTNPSPMPAISVTAVLKAGDVIRAHDGVTVPTSFSNLERCIFRITKVSN